MPPVLVHRAAAQRVDEIALGATPLGTMGMEYGEAKADLTAGDTVYVEVPTVQSDTAYDLVVGGLVLPLLWGGGAGPGWWGGWGSAGLGFALALGGELLGRYLFFVSVVPKHMAAPYLTVESEAA